MTERFVFGGLVSTYCVLEKREYRKNGAAGSVCSTVDSVFTINLEIVSRLSWNDIDAGLAVADTTLVRPLRPASDWRTDNSCTV